MHARTTVIILVSYKHNVAAKHVSSKPFIGHWDVTARIVNQKNPDIGLCWSCISGYVKMVHFQWWVSRAVASLTVPGGQEFHFPHFFLKFRSIFPQTLLIFFLILALRVGDSPTREGPGYATVSVSMFLNYTISTGLPRNIRWNITFWEINLHGINICLTQFAKLCFLFSFFFFFFNLCTILATKACQINLCVWIKGLTVLITANITAHVVGH